MDKKQSNIIQFPAEPQPVDLIISRHIQNMMATLGEEVVRAKIKELFGINIDRRAKAKKVS